jgi:hypothetical protein
VQKRLRYRDLEALGIVNNRPTLAKLDKGSRLSSRPIDRAEQPHMGRSRSAAVAREPPDRAQASARPETRKPPRSSAQGRGSSRGMTARKGAGPESAATDPGAQKNVGSGKPRSSKPQPQNLQAAPKSWRDVLPVQPPTCSR